MNLKSLAYKMAAVYAESPKLDAVMIAGSVSRDWEDEFSDIELHLFWREAISDEDRLAPIKTMKGEIIDFHEYEDEEWSETFWLEGVKFEISSFLTTTVLTVVEDVVYQFDTNPDKQCIVAAVGNGIPLFGHVRLDELKKVCEKYPEKLSEKMIIENLDFGGRWSNRYALLHREDWLMLYEVMVSVQSKVMGVLFGLNRLYVHHPAFKWQKQSLGKMSVLPFGIAERLDRALLSHPKEGLPLLETVVQDIFVLLKEEKPEMDVAYFKEKSLLKRSR